MAELTGWRVRWPRLLPRVQSDTSKRLYFVGFGVVSFLAPLLIFYGVWASQQTKRDFEQIQYLLGQRAVSAKLNAEMFFRQQMAVLGAVAAFSLFDGELEPGRVHAELDRVEKTAAPLDFISVIGPDNEQVVNTGRGSLPRRSRVEAETVREVFRTGKPVLVSCLTPDPQVTDKPAIVVIYPVVRDGVVRYALVGGIPYSYLQTIIVNQGTNEEAGYYVQSIVDADMRLIGRSRGNDQFFASETRPFYRTQVEGRTNGVFHMQSLDGVAVYTTFTYSEFLGWYFNIAADADKVTALLDRSDRIMLMSMGLGLTLFISIGIIQASNLMDKQIQAQRINDERLAAVAAAAALDERNTLLKEVYHRVKNNLQVIQSFIRLSAKRQRPEVRPPFEEAIQRIDAIATVHALLYQSDNLEFIDYRQYLKKVVTNLAEVYSAGRQVKTQVKAQSLAVGLEMAVPLGLVTIELLTNAYKHAFDGRQVGSVKIQVYALDEARTCGAFEIEDDGPGVGANFRDRNSLGVRLIQNLVVQLNGEIEWPEVGSSRFRFTFALNSPNAVSRPLTGSNTV